MDVAEVVTECVGLGGVAVEFFPCFELGIFFVDVDVLGLFMEQVA